MLEAIDIILIHQLLGRYGHALDAAEWDALATLFTDDAVLDYTAVRAPKVYSGPAEIVEYFRPANHPSAHHVTNIVVDEHADPAGRVDVHSKFIAPFTRERNVPLRIYGGDYHDVVVKSPDGWRFAAKTCVGRWQYTPSTSADLPDFRRTF
jgi:3-phenylpropionate/cinnamic acid dioxygenase small subunit